MRETWGVDEVYLKSYSYGTENIFDGQGQWVDGQFCVPGMIYEADEN